MENKKIIVTVGAPVSSGAVDSVNGKTGVVVIDGTDVELIAGGGVTVTQAISDLDADVQTRVQSVTAGEPTGSDKVENIVSLTQAEYDAGTPNANTFYIITG